MDTIESIARRLQQRGFYVTLRFARPEPEAPPHWICESACSLEVMKANLPRPTSTGVSALEALSQVEREINALA